nr:uncharacterized protein LOC113814795 [Penaeus vannamei]
MYQGPRLPDIAEAEEEPAEDSLSSASTASFWSHERELYDPWWRSTPPTAAAIRASSSTPPLYRGLIRTAPPTSPVRTRPRRSTKPSTRGRSTTPPAHSTTPPRRRTSRYVHYSALPRDARPSVARIAGRSWRSRGRRQRRESAEDVFEPRPQEAVACGASSCRASAPQVERDKVLTVEKSDRPRAGGPCQGSLEQKVYSGLTNMLTRC